MMLKRLCSLIALAPLALASFAGMPAEARDKTMPEDPDITEFLALNQPDLEAVESFSQNTAKEQTETKTGADPKQDIEENKEDTAQTGADPKAEVTDTGEKDAGTDQPAAAVWVPSGNSR